MTHTTILSTEYKDDVNQYENKEVLFYLDPPYEGSKNLYNSHNITYNEIARLLLNIKGKFRL